jgi:hypothetical protein
LGLLGLLLLVAATASEELWGPGLGTPRPRARVAAVWVLGGLAMTYVVGFASLLVLGSTGTTTASTLPALSSDTSGPLLLVCVLLGLQFTAPFFSAKLRVTTLGPRTGAICFVTEASYVALCWGLAVAFFTWRIALPTTLPLIAMVMGAVAWAGLARFAPEDPWSRIGLGLHALLVVAVLVFCVYVVATAAGRGQVVQTATGTLVSIGLLILAANPLQKAIERSSHPGP